MTRYRTLKVDDLEIFYREAGPPDAPVLLLPHGFRMAMARPERLEALIVQNAVAHDSGLGPLWAGAPATSSWTPAPTTPPGESGHSWQK
ncbi:hypothetical protein OG588_15455 [Streptomyces prunicolor]|uniref:alpha/beta fold hydrolase n=1 Tax=Streptomyces prunicolor TaxID=67348 RepID=UPI003870E878|nr:hypothetical protein OG588_15455 [Streptomyces prunicolor]